MAEYGAFTVRPFSKAPRTDLKDVFKVFLSSANFLLKGIKAGQHCHLRSDNGQPRSVVVFPAPEKIQDSVVQTSKTLQQLYGIKLGDKISLSPTTAAISDARKIVLHEVLTSGSQDSSTSLLESEYPYWAWSLKHLVLGAELVSPGLAIENVSADGQKRSFYISSVNDSCDQNLFQTQKDAQILVTKHDNVAGTVTNTPILKLSALQHNLGGLSTQIKKLDKRLSRYLEGPGCLILPPWVQRLAHGIILHGPAGTGKTRLLQMTRELGWQGVFDLDVLLQGSSRMSEKEVIIRNTFAEARLLQPSIILLDDIESVAGKVEQTDASHQNYLSKILGKELDRLDGTKILVLSAARSLSAIDQDLRKLSRFSVEIEIPVPSSKSRAEILKLLTEQSPQQPDRLLDLIASQTHGFVGADLSWLLQEAAEIAIDRAEASLQSKPKCDDLEKQRLKFELTLEDFQAARKTVRPTALHEIFVETPEVHWSDIAGQEQVKKTLERALIWPVQFEDDMKRFDIQPRRGLLLFGPPGCSKTMIGRAAATESGYNFLAVKGAELINMYVGESERAIRDLFRKARSVAPSIVFFDEIDAIGTTRNDNRLTGLNVVTTLLNELDGIEESKGVFVLAATNRPDVIDPALLRAGRLDSALFVGPPDQEATMKIFDQHLARMDVDDDVNSQTLASTIKGLSGAELISICRRAKENALEDRIKSKVEIKVGYSHFWQAHQEVQTVITQETLDSYAEFAARMQAF